MLKYKHFLDKNFFRLKTLENEIINVNKIIPTDFGGGSSLRKVNLMAAFIYLFDFDLTIDVGVYRGKSFFPQAIAHRKKKRGKVIGIDPYSNDNAFQKDRKDLKVQLREFALKTDFESIYIGVKEQIKRNGLMDFAEILRKPSADAVKDIRVKHSGIDMIHIDGNHDTEFVMQDVENYIPLLSNRGVIILDDISWDSVKPAYTYLNERTTFIGQKVSDLDDFAVFSSGFCEKGTRQLRRLFRKIALG